MWSHEKSSCMRHFRKVKYIYIHIEQMPVPLHVLLCSPRGRYIPLYSWVYTIGTTSSLIWRDKRIVWGKKKKQNTSEGFFQHHIAGQQQTSSQNTSSEGVSTLLSLCKICFPSLSLGGARSSFTEHILDLVSFYATYNSSFIPGLIKPLHKLGCNWEECKNFNPVQINFH